MFVAIKSSVHDRTVLSEMWYLVLGRCHSGNIGVATFPSVFHLSLANLHCSTSRPVASVASGL